MSKAAKAQAKLKRLSLKRANKSRQKAQYELWMSEGTNKKSRRTKIAAKKAKNQVRMKRHLDSICGNPFGCQVCGFSNTADPHDAEPGSALYGKQFAGQSRKDNSVAAKNRQRAIQREAEKKRRQLISAKTPNPPPPLDVWKGWHYEGFKLVQDKPATTEPASSPTTDVVFVNADVRVEPQ